jgi:tRNA A37 threonylcarbamoyladenosine synthetase subunit TsaC/SUA5/YrdC
MKILKINPKNQKCLSTLILDAENLKNSSPSIVIDLTDNKVLKKRV